MCIQRMMEEGLSEREKEVAVAICRVIITYLPKPQLHTEPMCAVAANAILNCATKCDLTLLHNLYSIYIIYIQCKQTDRKENNPHGDGR